MSRICLQAGLAAGIFVLSVSATLATTLQLVPANTQMGLTVYAMGMFPQAGHFGKFSGTLSVEPGHPESCRVAMQVDVTSLVMSTQTGTHTALSPTMLDPARFPTLGFEGDCDPGNTHGQLTLHGVTRALTLTATRDAKGISAHGTLRRQDFGIVGFPALIGSTIKVVFSVDLPPGLAEEIPH
jgi:polyisoprenoid-binding protein YceI